MFDLETVRARDAMSTDVVVLQALAPLREALETLEDYNIHGAPVVNEAGELVGSFSDTDVIRRDTTVARAESDTALPWRLPPSLAETGDNGGLEVDNEDDENETISVEDESLLLDREIVADWMSHRVVSVAPDETVGEVCRLMAREHVHRVFVVEDERIIGVISAFDIVSLIAQGSSNPSIA